MSTPASIQKEKIELTNSIYSYLLYSEDRCPEKVMIFVHGLGVYTNLYRDWLDQFVENGYAIYCFDLPGHGLSLGMRGDIGSYESLFLLIDRLFELSKRRYVSIPVVLYGHSLGGNIVLSYLKQKKNSVVAATVVTGPWLQLNGRFYCLASYISSFLNKRGLHLIVPRKIKLLEDLKRNNPDPYLHYNISTDTFYQAQAYGKDLLQKNSLDDQILIVHGLLDRVTSADLSRKLALFNSNTTFKGFDKTAHHLLYSEECATIFKYINHWIDESI
ncbi:lysophospholipase [Halosquirtibacter laminarini]|uniref:Lysophospholipase n=1 Tax=Halosquirtibacter laminarini TaxID=3374600 RepID=A0AC61NJ11_9BACT|nr:lysophospholipase [Prolixibacteraceae bacterium]